MNNKEIEEFLQLQGTNLVSFVDISELHPSQNRNFNGAVIFGIVLSKQYIISVSQTPSYVQSMKEKGEIQFDEFYLSEVKTDNLADQLADKIMDKGYTASSQSEKNLAKIGVYDLTNNTTPLPHKTVARLAGWGWIGKHNLLVTHAHGSAISMCTVLTNAPLQGSKNKLVKPDCGRCNRCVEVCATAALSGTTWNMGIERNKMVNVKTCTTCLQCMMQCKFTQAYAAGTSEQSFSLE